TIRIDQAVLRRQDVPGVGVPLGVGTRFPEQRRSVQVACRRGMRFLRRNARDQGDGPRFVGHLGVMVRLQFTTVGRIAHARCRTDRPTLPPTPPRISPTLDSTPRTSASPPIATPPAAFLRTPLPPPPPHPPRSSDASHPPTPPRA